MPILQKPNVTLYAAMQNSQGAAATITGADAVDFNRDSKLLWPKGELIDRGLNRARRFPSQKFVGGQWGEGQINHEVRGSGTAGTAPSGLSPFLETLFGSKLANIAGTVADAAASTTEFDSALNLTVGQLIRVAIGSGYEVRRVSDKSGAGPYTYTVSRAFSQAPVDTAVICAGVTYAHLGTETEKYMTVEEYVGTVRHTFLDAFCEAMSLNAEERKLLVGDLAVRSLSYDKTLATPDPYTEAFDDTLPHAAVLCNMRVDGTLLDMKSIELKMETRRTRGGINSAGFSAGPWRAVFDASGKLAPWVEDFAPFDSFFAGTLADLEILKGTSAGNLLAIHIEDIQYSGAEVGEDEGDFIWDLPFEITGGVYIGLF